MQPDPVRGSGSKRVRDVWHTASDFAELLSKAEDHARSNWELDFTAEMREKYTTYGLDTFISSAQHEKLNMLAERGL